MPSKTGKALLFEARPELRGEWDYNRNTGLNPEVIVAGSGKDVWWRCTSGHEWQARISSRGKDYRNCRECAINLQRELADHANPIPLEISKQLDDQRYPLSRIPRSLKVQWSCEKGHKFLSTVSSRIRGSGCPYCCGKLPIVGETDLATLRPDLAAEWDDDTLSPMDVTIGSGRKVGWKCSKGHRYKTSVNTRSAGRTRGNGCPHCPGARGRYAQVTAGVNDLATARPDLAAEMISAEITAQELRPFSSRKVLWKCPQGHIYSCAVAERSLGTGCGECSLAATSMIEGRLRTLVASQPYLSGTILDANHKLPVPWRRRKSMRVDIYCVWQNLPLVIEYDGSYWHRDKVEDDMEKTQALLCHGYLVVRVRENSLPLLDIYHPNLLQLNVTWSPVDGQLESALSSIEAWLIGRS